MTTAEHGWGDELRDQVRALSGAVLFGLPLLYTMEVWWIGAHTSPPQMAVVLLGTFATVAALTHVAGFRDDKDKALGETLMDSCEAVAMGLLVSLLILTVTREVSVRMPLSEFVGKLVYHSITASIGVALAAQFFRGSADTAGDDDAGTAGGIVGTVVDLGASAIGAVFLVSAIAPTDEIRMLAGAATPGWLLAVMMTSLAVSYGVVFVSGFSNEEQRRMQPGVLQHPITETVAAYLIALLVSAVSLVTFQRIDLADPYAVWAPQVVLLGLPAAIGGAAGRLAV